MGYCLYILYANGTQIYLSCEADDTASTTTKIEVCIDDIKSWMAANFLEVNDDMTEIMLLRSKLFLNKVSSICFQIGRHTD